MSHLLLHRVILSDMKEKIRNLKKLNPSWGYKRIAKEVDLSPNTVRYHLSPDVQRGVQNRSNQWKSKILSDAKLSLGGKCCVCDYDRHFSALDFHHVLSDDKIGCPSEVIKNLGKKAFLEEVEKCILVCSNCHREIHDGIILEVLSA